MTITEKLSHLRGINIAMLFDDILRDNEEEILGMNRDQMYEEGTMDVNVPNKKEKYSPATIRAKRRAPYNKTEFVTLKWMGDFHGSLKLLIFKDKFVISSDNRIWANYLETNKRFGRALGMTEKSKGKLRDTVRTEMIKKLKDVI